MTLVPIALAKCKPLEDFHELFHLIYLPSAPVSILSILLSAPKNELELHLLLAKASSSLMYCFPSLFIH
jgi:hypothetical protein